MDKGLATLIENAATIIAIAARTPAGLAALVVLVIGVIAVVSLRRAPGGSSRASARGVAQVIVPALVVVAAAALAVLALSQARSAVVFFEGQVRDKISGKALPGASVRINAPGVASQTSDSEGIVRVPLETRFLENTGAVSIEIQREGYRSLQVYRNPLQPTGRFIFDLEAMPRSGEEAKPATAPPKEAARGETPAQRSAPAQQKAPPQKSAPPPPSDPAPKDVSKGTLSHQTSLRAGDVVIPMKLVVGNHTGLPIPAPAYYISERPIPGAALRLYAERRPTSSPVEASDRPITSIMFADAVGIAEMFGAMLPNQLHWINAYKAGVIKPTNRELVRYLENQLTEVVWDGSERANTLFSPEVAFFHFPAGWMARGHLRLVLLAPAPGEEIGVRR